MSIHVNLSPEAEAKLRSQRRTATIFSILISILVLILLGLLMAFILLNSFRKDIPKLISYQIPLTEQTVIEEIVQEVETIQRPPSAPPSALNKVIAASTPSALAVPVPEIDVTAPSLDFGDQNDFANGFNFGTSGESGGGDGQSFATLFGQSVSTGLRGQFYDLKQTSTGEISELGEIYEISNGARGSRIKPYAEVFRSLSSRHFSESKMKDYFKADRELYLDHLVMGNDRATTGPEAFGVDDSVEPSGWLVIYKGTVTKPSDRFRFRGVFDDLMVIYVNNKIVLDASFSPGYTDKYRDYKNSSDAIIGPKTTRISDYLKLKPGDKVVIAVGEVPGGYIGGGIFVEMNGKDYPNGYPPFCTTKLKKSDKKRLEALTFPVEMEDVPIFHFQ